MKKSVLKTITLICTLALLFHSVFIGVSLVTDADGGPDELTLVTGSGNEGGIYHPGGSSNPQKTFNGSANGWQNNQIIRLNHGNTVDLSQYNTLNIEFYYSGQQAYEAWLPHLDIQLWADNKARFPMPDDLISGQWNTITLDLDVARNQLDLSQCVNLVIKSHPGGTTDAWRSGAANGNDTSQDKGYTDSTIPNFTFRTGRIYAQKSQNDPDVLSIPLDRYRFWGQSGKTFDYAKHTISLSSSVNISAYDNFEFDYFINDVAAMKRLRDTNINIFWTQTNVELIASDNTTTQTLSLFPYQFSANGNTHFSFAVSSINPTIASGLKKICITYPNLTASVNEFNANYVFGIVNICATKGIDHAPLMVDRSLPISAGKTKTWGARYNYTQDRLNIHFDQDPVNIGEAKRVEFDIYIEDYTAFAAAAQGQTLRFALSSDDNLYYRNRRAYNIYNKITHSGWNHVVIENLDLPDASTGTFDPSHIRYVYLSFWSGSTAQNPIGNTTVRISGICATDHVRFGMNIHHSGYQSYPASNREQNLNRCNNNGGVETLGVDIVRYNNSCGSPEAIAEVQAVAAACYTRNMKLMLVVESNFWDNLASIPNETLEARRTRMYNFFYSVAHELRNEDADIIYQLSNEIDNHCIRSGAYDGNMLSHYDEGKRNRALASMKGALEGVRAGDPSAKVCFNFAWRHTALLYELYDQGYHWDITGIDWYSDCDTNSSYSIEALLENVSQHISDGSDIMICETNYWTGKTGSSAHNAALENRSIRNAQQAVWVPSFLDKIANIPNPRLKAVMCYELLDEPAIEYKNVNGQIVYQGYNGEAHFGFIECNRNGGDQVLKPAFYTLQAKIAQLRGVS